MDNEKQTLDTNEFCKFLPFKDRTYRICGYIGSVDEYEDNRGYIDKDTGSIYICSKDKPPVHLDVPIIFVSNTGNISLKEITNAKTYEIFKESSLCDLSSQYIISTTKGDEQLYDEKALEDMNAASSVFTPIIDEDNDDALKKVIKKVILEKCVDINRLKSRMPNKYALSNMKSALIGKTKMSISNFNQWCEILGVNYEIVIRDNGSDMIDPLYEDIHFASQTNKLTTEPRKVK